MAGELNKQRAIENMRKAANLEDDPERRVILGARLARMYADAGKKRDAAVVLEKVLALMPPRMKGSGFFWKVCGRLADLYIELGEKARAEAVYAAVIRDARDEAVKDRARRERDKRIK